MVMNIEQEHQTHAQTHADSEGAPGKPSCQRTEEILFRITAKKVSFEQREKKQGEPSFIPPLCLHIFPLIIAEAPEFNAKKHFFLNSFDNSKLPLRYPLSLAYWKEMGTFLYLASFPASTSTLYWLVLKIKIKTYHGIYWS
jgi:hypothetical protein